MINADDIRDMAGPHLIGITGRAGSGKSTASQALVDVGWVRIKFAGPLKDMLRAIGLTDDHIDGDLKEVPCDLLCGQTPRHAMITLGTEWGRDIVSPKIWVNIAAHRIASALASGRNVVVDDVRFEDEAEIIRMLGGAVLGLERKSDIAILHKSESGVEPDITRHNSGTVDELRHYMVTVFAD